MKYLLLSCTLVLMLLACFRTSQPTDTQQDTTAVEEPFVREPYDTVSAPALDSSSTIFFDVNNDNKMDSIVFFDPIEGDPGAFNQVAFYISGMEKQTFTAKAGWDYANGDLQNTNLVHSDLLYINRQGDEVFFGIVGYQYGTGDREYAVFRYKDNKLTLLKQEIDDLDLRFEYYGTDHKLKAVVLPNSLESPGEREQFPDGYIEYYAPKHIYDLDSTMHRNDALTRQYNEQYYAWAGFSSSYDIIVYEPKDSSYIKRIIRLR